MISPPSWPVLHRQGKSPTVKASPPNVMAGPVPAICPTTVAAQMAGTGPVMTAWGHPGHDGVAGIWP